MNPVIGILAGMGPRTTSPFLNLLLDYSTEIYGATYDNEFPDILIYSLPTPFYPDRPLDEDLMKEKLSQGIKSLINGGADSISIPCNAVHIFSDFIKEKSTVPFLNMIDLTIKNLPSKSSIVGLAAASQTLNSNLYQKAIKAKGKTFVQPPLSQSKIDQIILDFKKHGYSRELQDKRSLLL